MRFPGKRPIREGDTTTHGGTVLPVTHRWKIGGRRVVVVGDKVMCPSCGLTVIVEGDPRQRLGGLPVAHDGHHTTCGASLIASLTV